MVFGDLGRNVVRPEHVARVVAGVLRVGLHRERADHAAAWHVQPVARAADLVVVRRFRLAEARRVEQ